MEKKLAKYRKFFVGDLRFYLFFLPLWLDHQEEKKLLFFFFVKPTHALCDDSIHLFLINLLVNFLYWLWKSFIKLHVFVSLLLADSIYTAIVSQKSLLPFLALLYATIPLFFCLPSLSSFFPLVI